jgi:HAE1 family hydrophobic/amphiphilic exporter-1
VIKTLKAKGGFVDIDTAQALRQPEVQVHVDRRKASDLGVRVDAIAAALRTMVGGEKVGLYREAGEQYDVRLRLKAVNRSDASVLSALTVPGAGGSLVKLANVADLGQGMGPGQIERYAQERSITVISNLLPS